MDNTKRRTILLGAIVSFLTVLILFSIVEISLRLLDLADPLTRRDPFYGFAGTNNVFQVKNIAGKGQYWAPVKIFGSDEKKSFPVVKNNNTFRIFVYGGSTTYGQPYSNEGAFSRFLEKGLSRAYPGINFEVINVGVKGHGSSRVLEIYKETLNYEPDMAIIYTGQNEDRDAHFHYWELNRSPVTAKLMRFLFNSRFVYLIHENYLVLEGLVFGNRITSGGANIIERLLEEPFSTSSFNSYEYYRLPVVASSKGRTNKESTRQINAGLEYYLKHVFRVGWMPLQIDEMLDNYEANLNQFISLAEDVDIPVIFLRKAVNTQEVKSRSKYRIEIDLAPEQLKKWENHYRRALKFMQVGKYEDALAEFLIVRSLWSGRDLLLSLFIGNCYEKLKYFQRAVGEYESRVPEEDKLLDKTFDTVVVEPGGNHYIDVFDLFKRRSRNGIVGYDNFFVDRVHMTIDGYRTIGEELTNYIVANGFVDSITNMKSGELNSYLIDIQSGILASLSYPERMNAALGMAHFNLGRIRSAEKFAKLAIEHNPDDVQIQFLNGLIYQKVGDKEKARKTYLKIKDIYNH